MELSASTVAVYTSQAIAGMRRALGRFDDDSVNRRPHGPDTNSAAALIVHACAASVFWFEHVGLGQPTERDRDSEFNATASTAELHRLLDDTDIRLGELATALEAGPTAGDHELRAFLPGDDQSDGAVALHALEELFQHVGHLELTADAITSNP